MTEPARDHFLPWEDKVIWAYWNDLPQIYARLSHRTNAQIHMRRWKLKTGNIKGRYTHARLRDEIRFRCSTWLAGHLTTEAAKLGLNLAEVSRKILTSHFEKQVFAQERGQNRRQTDAHTL